MSVAPHESADPGSAQKGEKSRDCSEAREALAAMAETNAEYAGATTESANRALHDFGYVGDGRAGLRVGLQRTHVFLCPRLETTRRVDFAGFAAFTVFVFLTILLAALAIVQILLLIAVHVGTRCGDSKAMIDPFRRGIIHTNAYTRYHEIPPELRRSLKCAMRMQSPLNQVAAPSAHLHSFESLGPSFRPALGAQNPAAYRPDLAETLNNLGLLFGSTNRSADAEAALKEAADIRRELVVCRTPTGPFLWCLWTTWRRCTGKCTATAMRKLRKPKRARLRKSSTASHEVGGSCSIRRPADMVPGPFPLLHGPMYETRQSAASSSRDTRTAGDRRRVAW